MFWKIKINYTLDFIPYYYVSEDSGGSIHFFNNLAIKFNTIVNSTETKIEVVTGK